MILKILIVLVKWTDMSMKQRRMTLTLTVLVRSQKLIAKRWRHWNRQYQSPPKEKPRYALQHLQPNEANERSRKQMRSAQKPNA